MNVERHDLSATATLFRAYSELVAGTPLCYDVSRDEFVSGATYRGPWRRSHLIGEAIVAAEVGGEIVGFAQVGEAPAHDGDQERGVMRFFVYPRGRREVGRAILRAVDAYFDERGLRAIEAFVHGYTYRPYQVGFGALSATLGHVHGLLGAHGYRVADGELFLEWVGFDRAPTRPPDPAVDVSIKTEEGRGALPNFTLTATLAGESVGECVNHSVGHYSMAPEAQDAFFTAWLGVPDGFQGAGWGKYLLSETLRVARRLGYQDAVISTDARNYRAMLLYTNLGYRVVDTAYSFRSGT